MSQETWTAVDRYISDLLVRPDEALEAALKASAEAGLPDINVTPNQGKLLMLLAKIQQAKTILEIGTLGGYSTIWLARALPPGGRLVTLESEPLHARVAAANFERAGLGGTIDLRLGKALDLLPLLESEGVPPFDLVFIDADKANIPSYFEWALKLSRQGTLIITDNVVRNGAVADPETADVAVQGVRKFNEILAKEARVTSTAIQTVGTKGYDGFALTLVESAP